MNIVQTGKYAAELLLFCLLTAGLYTTLKYYLDSGYKKTKKILKEFQDEYNSLSGINLKIKEENEVLRENLDEIVALYDITREICKSLDEASIFSYFDGLIHRYVEVTNCRFVKGEIKEGEYPESSIMPLEVGRKVVGYLVCDGIRDQDREKFQILAHQYLLGLKRAILYEKVQELAITDSLTRVLSRRYWLERFTEEIERSRKFKHNFSCLMLDVDHFKKINDHYGHMVGEIILKEVGGTIKDAIRQIDLVGRYGGEEFSVFLAETGLDEARVVAERIRASIENRHIRAYDEELQVTISIGIAMFPEHANDSQGLLSRADEALYQAKKTGRNRVCTASA
jgi:diguanylate cyclase (GGDEF)-like protein